MKKRILFIMTMACLILSGCAKDNISRSGREARTFEFSLDATLDGLASSDEATKASATAVVRLSWSKGDQISVINLTTGKALGGSLTADATGTTTTFSGTLTGTVGSGDKLVFLYPSQGYTEEQDYQPVTVDLSSQAGSVKDGVPICVYATTSASSNVFNKASAKFNFLMSYIQLSFSDLAPGELINSVSVEDIGSSMSLSLTADGIEATPSVGTITMTPSSYSTSSSGTKSFYMTFAESPKVDRRRIVVSTASGYVESSFSGSKLVANTSYTAIVTNFTETTAPSSFVNIPDPAFKAYCVENFDTDGDGEISYDEAQSITEINVNTIDIYSLEGIECFTKLTGLVCSGVRNYSSEGVLTSDGKLTSLDVSKNSSLLYLTCHENQLTSLDLSGNTALIYLDCNYNNLTDLDVSNNTALIELSCQGNQLTSLDVSKNTALTTLACGENKLTILDVGYNINLTYLWCRDMDTLFKIVMQFGQSIENRYYPQSTFIEYTNRTGSAYGHDYVDLGLPSGLKWATMNVGATKITESGDYFAWGAVEPWYEAGYAGESPLTHLKPGKSDGYVRENAPYFVEMYTNGHGKYSKYIGSVTSEYKDPSASEADAMKTVLDPEDDAAHVNWGGAWRMPTDEECQELLDNCTFSDGTVNGVLGVVIRSNIPGYTDRWIFFPPSGTYMGVKIPGRYPGFWWSSSVSTDIPSGAQGLLYGEMEGLNRDAGVPVRPVLEQN